jgi:Fe-S-cluster containining protein
MSLSHEEAVAALEELYAELPTIECQGLCWNSCGPIDMSDVERRRISERGVDIGPRDDFRTMLWVNNVRAVNGESLLCPALDQFHRCTVYEVRPLICRAWGVGRGEMACPYGCAVSDRRLKQTEITKLLWRSLRIGGAPDGMDPPEGIGEEVLADPVVAQLLVRFTNGEHNLAPQLRTAMIDAARRLTST